MYNKLFSKIVDSSIWLEPSPTRIVWVMFIAIMDEDGFVQIASAANVAHKARISETEAKDALSILESPDPNSANPAHEGRRIERVEGGWMVLNARDYRDTVTREIAREQVRKRVAAFRARKRNETEDNGVVTPCNDSVTTSETISEAGSEEKAKEEKKTPPTPLKGEAEEVAELWNALGKPFPQVVLPLSSGRKKTLRQRLAEPGWRSLWQKAISKIPEKPFLCGENDNGWVADFEFFIRPDSVSKIMEGKYEPRVTPSKRPKTQSDLLLEETLRKRRESGNQN